MKEGGHNWWRPQLVVTTTGCGYEPLANHGAPPVAHHLLVEGCVDRGGLARGIRVLPKLEYLPGTSVEIWIQKRLCFTLSWTKGPQLAETLGIRPTEACSWASFMA